MAEDARRRGKDYWVQNKKSVQNLTKAVEDLTKKQEGFFSKLTTTGYK